jgi:hypothetical protein
VGGGEIIVAPHDTAGRHAATDATGKRFGAVGSGSRADSVVGSGEVT